MNLVLMGKKKDTKAYFVSLLKKTTKGLYLQEK